MEELTVPEILQGLLRKEYFDHRSQLLQLLINQFANENEEEAAANSQLVVSDPTKKHAGKTETVAAFNTEDKKSLIAPKVDKRTFQQLVRILLEFASNEKLGNEVINFSLAALVNATIKHEYGLYFLEYADLANQTTTNFVSQKFHELIQKYLAYNPQIESDEMCASDFVWESFDPHQYMGDILCNLCQYESGRKLILHTGRNYMISFPSQIRSRNPIRRRGAVGSIRSCLFDQEYHWWMLNEVRVLTPLLIPLTVPTILDEKDKEGMDPTIWLQAENPNKKFEPDLSIMKMLLECLILLCQRRGIREELRKRKVYPIMRNLDVKIEDEAISTAIYEVVNFLIGEEDPNTPIDTDDHQTLNK